MEEFKLTSLNRELWTHVQTTRRTGTLGINPYSVCAERAGTPGPERGRFRISTHFIEVAALDALTELLLKIIRHPESLPHPLESAPPLLLERCRWLAKFASNTRGLFTTS
jgi:hypothetical protein